MAWTRRDWLRAGAAGLAAGFRPSVSSAREVAPADRRFVFVVNFGGWDPTRVFLPAFDHPAMAMEPDAAPAVAHGLPYVDHAARPSVRAFFEGWGHRTALLNGVLVPSVAHDACLQLVMTGRGGQDAADWPALIAGASADRFSLPHAVVSGPSFPGPYRTAVTRSGSSDQLVGLLSGDLADAADVPVARQDWRAEAAVDHFLARRAAAWREATGPRAELGRAYQLSIERARELKDLLWLVDWTGGADFGDAARIGVDFLRLGLSRCVTLQYLGNEWDTHQVNDASQSTLFEGLFRELVALAALLDATPGATGGTLAEETVVVVLSEMGRTPQLNVDLGKDHWPVTSAMMWGAGLTGGRAVGGVDDLCYGRPLDLATGELDPGGATLSADVLGGTILRLAGLDPNLVQTGTRAVEGLLR